MTAPTDTASADTATLVDITDTDVAGSESPIYDQVVVDQGRDPLDDAQDSN